MVLPVFVRAEDGQNGDPAPAPSSCIDVGTTFGFRTFASDQGCILWYPA